MSEKKWWEKPSTLMWIGAVAIFLLIGSLFLYFMQFNGAVSSDQGVWGAFGDYVGGLLNPVFALLALIALLLTIRLQSDELRNSSQALKDQNNTLVQQNFERVFFEMLSFQDEIVRSIDIETTNSDGEDIVYTGRDSFKFIFSTYKNIYESNDEQFETELEKIRNAYDSFYENYEAELGHYFRYLYNIIKFVDNGDVFESDKRFFANLVRAQLSSYELLVLFYSCLSDYGNEKFAPLLSKYALLKHLPVSLLIDESHYSEYPNFAYIEG